MRLFSRIERIPRSTFLLLSILLLHAPTLHAQTGALAGRVTEEGSGAPLSGATIRVSGSGNGTQVSGGISHSDGSFTVKGIPAGTYTVEISYVSYTTFHRTDVKIAAGETTRLEAALAQHALSIDEIVVSASRRPEKVTSAPASVSVVSAREIQEQPALTTVEHLKGITGLDIVQSGLTQSNVVARGFNNAFSGTLMVLTDNRIASVPSLRLNAYNFIPLVNEDIQQIEVIRGPGSALYGPNTANGVLHILTRSPFSSTGTWLSVAGGERDLFQGMMRHAGTIGERLGYKISAQYMRGTDWGFTDSVELAARRDFLADTAHRGVLPDTLRIARRDSSIERVAGEVRLDYAPTDDLTAILAVGANMAVRNPDITGVGGAQARNWLYTYYQARVLYRDLFVQAFLNRSDAGESYLLRTGAPVVDRSTQFVAQAQYSNTFEGIGRLAYGVDYLLTNPVTDSTITGGNEGNDDITEVGAYVQAEATLIPERLDLVAAGRVDRHSRLKDPIFSPRAALVYTPAADQTIRATFNTAYSAPTTNDLFLDIVAQHTPVFDVRATGVPENGFTFQRGTDGHALMHGNPLFGYDASPRPVSDIAPAWHALQALVRASGIGLLDSVAPPPASTVELRTVNAGTGGFDSTGEPADRPGIRPTINSTFELGYRGVIEKSIVLSVDLYRSHYHDFIGPLQAMTPNVFFNRTALTAYLLDALSRMKNVGDSTQLAELARVLADTASKIPFGVISPVGATDPNAVLFASRNYGDITIYGYDIGVQAAVTRELTLNGTASYVDKNFFHNLDGVSDLALNAPKFKYSVGAEYRNPAIGLNADARLRHVDGFAVNSGVYIGSVPSYSVVDVNVGYRLPFVERMNLGLSVQNLLTWVEGSSESPFTLRHAEFVGTPALGRLAMLRATYEFR
ncbi:MAG TPA: TonB-dependent receptor [Candidatus Kapabacteria bacterium]|nr:TonB-dependent receptor [Candidatus Kapabacteria bacterium]